MIRKYRKKNHINGFSTIVLVPKDINSKSNFIKSTINNFFFPLKAINISSFVYLSEVLKTNIKEDMFNKFYNVWVNEISETSGIDLINIIEIINYYKKQYEII